MQTSQRVGRWTLLRPETTDSWLCRCECGTERTVLSKNLVYNRSRSCGCLKKETHVKIMGTMFPEAAHGLR